MDFQEEHLSLFKKINVFEYERARDNARYPLDSRRWSSIVKALKRYGWKEKSSNELFRTWDFGEELIITNGRGLYSQITYTSQHLIELLPYIRTIKNAINEEEIQDLMPHNLSNLAFKKEFGEISMAGYIFGGATPIAAMGAMIILNFDSEVINYGTSLMTIMLGAYYIGYKSSEKRLNFIDESMQLIDMIHFLDLTDTEKLSILGQISNCEIYPFMFYKK